jgi:hypothetical protein
MDLYLTQMNTTTGNDTYPSFCYQKPLKSIENYLNNDLPIICGDRKPIMDTFYGRWKNEKGI